MLHSAVGQVKQYDGEIYIVTQEGDSGVVVFGPYNVLRPASYEVEFYAMPHEFKSGTCCVVDVLRRGRTVVAEKDFTAVELSQRNGIIPVRFEVIEQDTFEFRLTATGVCGLNVRYKRPLRLISSPADEHDASE